MLYCPKLIATLAVALAQFRSSCFTMKKNYLLNIILYIKHGISDAFQIIRLREYGRDDLSVLATSITVCNPQYLHSNVTALVAMDSVYVLCVCSPSNKFLVQLNTS